MNSFFDLLFQSFLIGITAMVIVFAFMYILVVSSLIVWISYKVSKNIFQLIIKRFKK